MPEQIFALQSYAFNSQSLPLFVAGALILFMSAMTLMHERGSRVAKPLFLLATGTTIWQFGFAIMYCSIDPQLARFWAQIAHCGIVVIPTTALYFTVRVVGHKSLLLKKTLSAAVMVSAMFCVLAFSSEHFISGVESQWWGPYPLYGIVGSVFVIFAVVIITTCITLFWRCIQMTSADSAMHHRAKLFLFASFVGAISAVDFLAMYGLAVYPIGRVTMFCLFAVTTYVTWRYRLVDLTLAFVGQQITDTMTDALIVMDREGLVRLTNEATEKLLGLSEAQMAGTSLVQLLDEDFHGHLESLTNGTSVRDVERTLHTVDGRSVCINLNASIMRDRYDAPIAFVYNLRDISHRKVAEERIRQLAFFDDLTALPNRVQFNEHLHRCLDIAKPEKIPVTTLFLDLDRFKRINDTLGHDAGDVLLSQVAERLRDCVNVNDLYSESHPATASSFVARLGGDEFIICLFDVADRAAIEIVARRILKALSEPFQLAQHEVFVSASVGISCFPDDGLDAQSLLKNADTAMYHAKDNGRDEFAFYHASMNATAMERLSLEVDLRKALEREQFSLVYQLQIDQSDGHIIGTEALLRWTHPVRGNVPPAEFIPLAEETGLIAAIGEWVLHEACRQTARWHRNGLPDITVAVNLSERQFRRQDLLQVVANALNESGLPADSLDLELTESMVMRKASASIETLKALKTMGVRISVDDFGTGYSSLSYLKRLPIDVVKVDGSFVRDIATSADDAAITTAIVAMARSLRIDVIAEGVETPEQMNFLVNLGCTKMQGYMFGRPMPAAAMENLLRKHTPDSATDTTTVVNFSRALSTT